MTGLVLKLSPGERILINGAVIENGDRRSRISILTPQTKILRMRDALHPDEVCTPVRRVVYMAQLVLSGDLELEAVTPQLLRGIEQLSQVLRDDDSHTHLAEASAAVVKGDSYRALKQLRNLLDREDRLFAMTERAS